MAKASKKASHKSKTELLGADVEMSSRLSTVSKSSKAKLVIIGVLVLVLAGVFTYTNYKLFLAGTVNNKPIFTWELNSVLQKKYGAKTLDQMIDMVLIRAEAKKEGVSATKTEVDAKIKELEAQVGGKEAMNQLLVSQNVSPDELNEQIELKIIVDKILEKKVKVSENDVEDFLAKNLETLPTTESGQQRKVAEDGVKQLKLSESFQTWYADLKKNAQIFKFY